MKSRQHEDDGLRNQVVKALRARLREINKRNQKPQQLKPKAVASITDVERTYPFYEQLSGDACHPGTDALSRYIAEDEIIPEPPLGDDEVFETFELLSLAVLSVCIGVSQMLGDAKDMPRLNDLAKTHVELRDALHSRSRRSTRSRLRRGPGRAASRSPLAGG